jgi:hypothetical protein
MRTITAKIEGTAPYSPSRYHNAEKLKKESHADYDLRTWREHCTYDEKGIVAIPAMAIKMALDGAAFKLKERVPGKGAKEWSGYFVSGVIPAAQHYSLGVHKDEVDFIDIWANADGRRGGSKRVMRRYPIITNWKATIDLDLIDDSIPTELVEKYLGETGNLIGIGRFRPEKGGFNGRFAVKSVKWSNGE